MNKSSLMQVRPYCSAPVWFTLLMFVLMGTGWSSPKAGKTLQIYFVDVEGGQATLFVTPAGQSLLIDTGWPAFGGRDADRIVAAAKDAGISKIDYVLIHSLPHGPCGWSTATGRSHSARNVY